jgi:hypothetical protein
VDALDPTTWPQEAFSEIHLQARAEKAKRCASRKDVLGWLRAVSPRIYRLDFCDLHEYQVETRHVAESGLEAPRYHAKTAIGCSGIPLFGACEEPELFDYTLNVQANDKKALAVNMGIKLEFEQNRVLRYLYGNLIGDDKWTDSLFVLKTGVVFQAASMGQSLKGTNYRLRRPNQVILDDAYDDDDIRNPESTQKKNDWVESTLEPLMANDRPTVLRWQGTAVNDVDGLMRLESKSKLPGSTTKFRRFCAFGHFEPQPDGRARWVDSPTVLWPALRDYAAWKAKQLSPGTNATIFNREMLNVRGGATEAVVHEEWLENPTWEYDPDRELRFGVDNILLAVIICCDPSVGKRQENDPTGFAVLLKTQRTDGLSLPHYWIDALRNERLSPQQRIDQIKSWLKHYRERFPNCYSFEVRIETVAGFMDFGEQVASQIDAPVEMLPAVADKLAHLESKALLLQNRRVHLNKFIDLLLRQEIKHQFTMNYPNKDDLRDAALIGMDAKDAGMNG